MTNANILITLRKAAGNVQWQLKDGRFRALFKGRGIALAIPNDTPRHVIVTRALAVQRELTDAHKGVLSAEAQELWSRKKG